MPPTSSRSHWRTVARIIEKERPDALLPTMGGQTALNCALDLARHGVLEKFGVELIGASREAIDKAEDREKFKRGHDARSASPRRARASRTRWRRRCRCRRSCSASRVVIRPSFTMGGTGGGIAYNREEFVAIVRARARGLAHARSC